MKYRYISLTLLAAFSATGSKAEMPQTYAAYEVAGERDMGLRFTPRKER